MDRNIFEELKCTACMEPFDSATKQPRMLHCGHTFCLSCLDKFWFSNESRFCSICEVRVLYTSVDSIPINKSLESLSERLAAEKIDEVEERETSPDEFKPVGYCAEHDIYNGLRCMNCKMWICGKCCLAKHKHCRTLLVEEAYEELKKLLSLRVEKEKGERKVRNESLKLIERRRKRLLEELNACEKQVDGLESLKLEVDKISENLSNLQIVAGNSQSYVEFSKSANEIDCLLQKEKKLFVDLEYLTPLFLESLATLCRVESVYAFSEQCDSPLTGKVVVKDNKVWIYSFQPATPNSLLISLEELLFKLQGHSELPKLTFMELTHALNDQGEIYEVEDEGVGSDEVEESVLEVIIETDSNSQRAKNFQLLCSALKGGGATYRGMVLKGSGSSYYQMTEGPHNVVAGIDYDDPTTPMSSGMVYGMDNKDSWFGFQLKNQPSRSRHKFGEMYYTGRCALGELKNQDCTVSECGLVISSK